MAGTPWSGRGRHRATQPSLRLRLWPGGGNVADRVANIIILSEDQEHENLIRRYLQRAGHSDRSFRPVARPGNRLCGSQHVRERFPEQVKECRGTLGRRASCLLIVITDADNLTPPQREQTLHAEIQQAGHGPVAQTEPIVILIPKWQVETWVKCALGQTMSEEDRDSDRPPVDADQIKKAAHIVFEWARSGAQVGTTCVPSLHSALPRWRQIG